MSKQWHGGKGDSPRKVDKTKYDEGWDRIFGKKERMPDNPWHDYKELTENGWKYENGEYVKEEDE